MAAAEGLAEASRLLKEGLMLLEKREREVDDFVARAEERAREITAEAEARAQQITAEADRQRVELEEQVAALRSELAQLREELAAATEARDAAVRSTATDVVQVDDEDRPASPVGEGTPRWGRRSNEGAQAIRTTRSSRRRWWLPFF